MEMYMTEQHMIPQELGADGTLTGIEKEIEIPYPFDAEKISISNIPVPAETLIRRLKQQTIRSPLIQRGAGIWGDEQQSRLIESLLLKIPLPMFYVAADDDEIWFVVDGLQRVTAIRRFVIDQEFALSGLEFLGKEYNGLKFEKLPQKMRNRILESQFTFAVINPSTPPNVQRNVFKRLNTGGLPLTPQEIRHALYYGPSAVLLEELAHSNAFELATDYRVDDSRMGARELVLRFLAFLIRGIDAYPRNEDMDAFLSETMQLINIMPDLPETTVRRIFGDDHSVNLNLRYKQISDIKQKFNIAMHRAHELFGAHAFRKSTPLAGYRTPVNKSLFECWAFVIAEMTKEEFDALVSKKKQLYKVFSEKINTYNSAFERSISRDSHKLNGVKTRYASLKEIISAVINEGENHDEKT
jgi:hypothetical protein